MLANKPNILPLKTTRGNPTFFHRLVIYVSCVVLSFYRQTKIQRNLEFEMNINLCTGNLNLLFIPKTTTNKQLWVCVSVSVERGLQRVKV